MENFQLLETVGARHASEWQCIAWPWLPCRCGGSFKAETDEAINRDRRRNAANRRSSNSHLYGRHLVRGYSSAQQLL